MERLPLEENIPNIKVLAEQMVRTNFGFEIDDLDNNQIPEGALRKIKSNNFNNNLKIQKNFTKTNPKIQSQKTFTNKKLNKIESEIIKNNLSSNKSKKKSTIINSKADISEFGKMVEGNSNIINTNTNVNTNINTITNLNSYLNTNANNNINTNNDNNINKENNINNDNNNNINNDNNNLNENEIYSENNSQIYPINENSSIISSNNYKDNKDNIDNKDKNEKIENNIINTFNQSELNESKLNKNDKSGVIVEIVNPTLLKKYRDDSFDDINTNNNTKRINDKVKKGKLSKLTLYEREMRNRQRRAIKLEKKREQLKLENLKNYKNGPEINPFSEELIEKQEIYVPIDKRAAKIHSLKISKIILNEENNKIKMMKKDEEELKKDVSRNKIFDQEEWDNFIEKQYLWKDEIEFKQKAEQIRRNNNYKKYLFKPKINPKSKSIIKDLQCGNDTVIDEVFIRLFNDYEEHKERQKLRNDQSLPSFKPKISKTSSQKNLNVNIKIPYRSGTTPLIPLRNNANMKKKYSISSKSGNGIKKNDKAKSQKLFCDLYNNNIEKYLGEKKSSKKKLLVNKTQATQHTNNTHSNANFSDINTDLINSKYIILENPLIKKNQSQNQIKPKKAYLPFNIKKMIDKNCNEKDEIKENSKIFKNNNNMNGISERRNYEDRLSHYDGSKYENENNDKENDDDYYNLEMGQKDSEGTHKIISILNNNKSGLNIYEKLSDKEKGKKFYGQSQNETINSDDSKFVENSLYKLNIRDSTPHLIKQDIILPSKDFSDFFDIPDLEDDI